ncbi:putative nucleic acid-binding Zn ribbon protein [Nocardioides thalensis]|uniref:Putative nucleic acid-binding Zn ribbon protein n=1 Tax=Nocardioides thalensis TaxID=1914755 RepID=A0A853CB01_9ACTN|nr:putative nucleic acid-binding Zn ribbon protein [Nocardioides thalensis]
MPDQERPDDPETPTSAGNSPEPGDDDHRPEGLDLARAILRGTAGGRKSDVPRRRTSKSGGGKDNRLWRRSRAQDVPTSGAHPGERDPQLLGSEVARIIEERGWGLDLQVRAVFARWGEIVGPEIGAHSTPEALTDGTLVVRTDSTAWATQLKLLAASLVKRLNAELGDGTVTVVEVLGPTAPSWKHGRLGTRDGRGPRDTYG